jgi:metal-sulfur cluster biosynthetic enzyme
MIVQWVEEAVIRELPSVSKATAEVVWEPAWNITMATEEVQAKLAGGM